VVYWGRRRWEKDKGCTEIVECQVDISAVISHGE
jgi:hypothetical protein